MLKFEANFGLQIDFMQKNDTEYELLTIPRSEQVRHKRVQEPEYLKLDIIMRIDTHIAYLKKKSGNMFIHSSSLKVEALSRLQQLLSNSKPENRQSLYKIIENWEEEVVIIDGKKMSNKDIVTQHRNIFSIFFSCCSINRIATKTQNFVDAIKNSCALREISNVQFKVCISPNKISVATSEEGIANTQYEENSFF